MNVGAQEPGCHQASKLGLLVLFYLARNLIYLFVNLTDCFLVDFGYLSLAVAHMILEVGMWKHLEGIKKHGLFRHRGTGMVWR